MKKEQRKSSVINSMDALMELMQGLRKWLSLFVGFGLPLGEIMSSSLTSNPLSSSNSSIAETPQIKYYVFRLSRRGNVKPSASPRKRELNGWFSFLFKGGKKPAAEREWSFGDRVTNNPKRRRFIANKNKKTIRVKTTSFRVFSGFDPGFDPR